MDGAAMITKADLKNLEEIIITSYESGVTLDEAEKLAARFLHAQFQVSETLKGADLDARMKKSAAKAIRAAVYMAEATKGDKKPSDVMLQAFVDRDALAQEAQNSLDDAEASHDELERYFSIFREAHIFYRGVSKGRFE